jgi:ribulose-phosphate 3-epimerase
MIDRRRPDCVLEVDGGLGESNVREVVAAGANALVMGSTIFGAADPGAELRRIRSLVL